MVDDTFITLGLRILIHVPNTKNEYYIEHEFTGDNWKAKTLMILPYYIDRSDVQLQTLHKYMSSIVWLENYLFKLKDIMD